MTDKPEELTWKQKTVIRILLLVARMLADGAPELMDELKSLHAHISAGDWAR